MSENEKKYTNLKKELMFPVLFFILLVGFIAADSNVSTQINISNSPPTLLYNIPNQSWEANSSNLNAFDLDYYFFDPNLDTLIYTYRSVENITIVIDSNNLVSFFPDPGFTGIRNTTFTASDGYDNTTSNVVFLIVGLDTEPPKWNSVSKSRTTIYQSDYVNFSAIWTDNYGLKSFIFSIKQGTSWVNYSEENFTGTQNTSIREVQISAAGGSVVYWRFYAYDTSDNVNATDIQNFTVSSYPSYNPPPVTGGGGGGTGGGAGAAEGGFFRGFFKPSKEIRDFSVEPTLMEIEAKQGELIAKGIKITNIGNKNLTLNIYQENLRNVAVFDKDSFTLLPGESKQIAIDFKIPKNLKPDLYFGYIVVNSTTSKKITILLNVKALNAKFDVDVLIPEKFKIVKPGKKVPANITITPLGNVNRGNGTLYIAIRDLGGNVYVFSEENIEFFPITNLERTLELPDEILEGDYIFYARFSAANETAIGSDSFRVGVKFRILAFLKTSFIFLILLLLAIILAILMHRYYIYHERERALRLYLMLTRLKKLLEEKKYDEALNLYIEIKSIYKEKIPEDIKENKERLREEIQKLAEKLSKQKTMEQNKENSGDSEGGEEKTAESSESSNKEDNKKNKSKKENSGERELGQENKEKHKETGKESQEKKPGDKEKSKENNKKPLAEERQKQLKKQDKGEPGEESSIKKQDPSKEKTSFLEKLDKNKDNKKTPQKKTKKSLNEDSFNKIAKSKDINKKNSKK